VLRFAPGPIEIPSAIAVVGTMAMLAFVLHGAKVGTDAARSLEGSAGT